MSRIIVENNRLVLEFQDQDKLMKFVELLRMLGVTGNVERREIIVKYDERFRDYLERDRQLSPRTVTDYMRYLKKLNGKIINYDLYLEISSNKWMVKCVRLYLDYLYKRGEISWEDYQKMRSVFKVKKKTSINNHRIDEEELVLILYDERAKEPEILVFKMLLYSGIRFSEAIRLINEFNDSKLECFDTHCRYAMFWSRGRKRCDWIFLPKNLVPEIRRHRGYYEGKKIHSLSRYFEKKYNVDLKLFRKLFYRICRQVCNKEICDFIESRISKLSIGDIHYDDLLERAEKEYPKIVKRIEEIIDEIKESMSVGIVEEKEEVIEVHNGDLVIKTDGGEEDVSEIERRIWEYHAKF